MSNFAPPIHPSQVQGIVNGLNQRITDLEQMLDTASRTDHGSRTILRGPEGDISKATEAAAKLMVEKFAAYEAKLATAISELKAQQNEALVDILNATEQFKATSFSWLQQMVQDSVKQLLVEAHILNPDGTGHESLKGEKGDTGAPGPQGQKGDSVVGPQGPKGDKGEIGELNSSDAEQVGRDLMSRVIYPYQSTVRNSLLNFETRLAALERK